MKGTEKTYREVSYTYPKKKEKWQEIWEKPYSNE